MVSGMSKNRSSHRKRTNVFVTETRVSGWLHKPDASCVCMQGCLWLLIERTVCAMY